MRQLHACRETLMQLFAGKREPSRRFPMNAVNSLKVVTALCFASLGLATFGQTSPATVPSPAKVAPSTQAMIHYGQLPLSFEPNRGQTSSNVQWLARGPEYT